MSPSAQKQFLSIGYFSPGWPPSAYPNGIVTYVAVLAEHLKTTGHRATVISSQLAPGEWGSHIYGMDRQEMNRGLPQRLMDRLEYQIAPARSVDRGFRRKLSATVKRAIAEQGIELLEIEESFGFARALQHNLSIPICVRLHGPWFLNGVAIGAIQDKVFERRVALEGDLIRNAVAITSPSRDTLEQTRAYYGLALKNAEVIPNSTQPVPESERWHLGGCDPKRILFIGRFDRHKGGDLIINAFARVLEQIPDAHLDFVGPDRGLVGDNGQTWTLENYVRQHIPGAIESGSVSLLGHTPHPQIPALRRGAMVTVACSRYENFPFTVVEAKAMGCPVVAAAVGGIPEIIEHETEGLLHRGGDADDLAAKILIMMTNPHRAAQLGRQAAEGCESFYPGAVAARSLDYYERCLGRSPVLSTAEGAS